MDASIIDNLPEELKDYLLEFLTEVEKTLVSMACKKWYGMIQRFHPGLRSKPGNLMCHATKHGYLNLMLMAKKFGSRVETGMRNAASYGRIDLMKILWSWDPPEYRCYKMVVVKKGNRQKGIRSEYGRVEAEMTLEMRHKKYAKLAMYSSARGGNIEGMKLAKSWGARNYAPSVYRAASGGHLECMILARGWISQITAEDIPWIKRCARNPALKLKQHIKSQLSISAKDALDFSAGSGHLECMELAKKWGADNYDRAMVAAAKKCQIECMKKLREWEALVDGKAIRVVEKAIDSYKKKLESEHNFLRDRRPRSYVTLKLKGNKKITMNVRVPTISQRTKFKKWLREKIKKYAECLELLKEWKYEDEMGELLVEAKYEGYNEFLKKFEL